MAVTNPLETSVISKLIQSGVDYVNNILSTFVPGGEVYEVAIIAFAIAYSLKTKNRWGTGGMVVATVVIFSSLRYFGIGGK